ncbi:MAG: hypothetical protein M1814_002544 [Vezdaea aestivalis]|nr:MAG: hypothetical protein M1814_002544 [Vezdaea aestivalis]
MLHQPQSTTSGRDPDNWYGVQDKRERKKIQDRLAQRSRRKRLAEMKQSRAAAEVQEQQDQSQNVHHLLHTSYGDGDWSPEHFMPSHSCSPDSVNPLDLYLGPQDHDADYSAYLSSCGALGATNSMNQYTVKAAETFSNMMNTVGSSRNGSSIPSVTAFAAMYNNAVVLQLSCEKAAIPMKSQVRHSVPEPLKPTHAQLTVPHLPYIDAIPFPAVRQNLIALNGFIDEEAFCGDLINPNSVSVIGNQSWDPEAWKMSDEFMKRWGYLFYQNAA